MFKLVEHSNLKAIKILLNNLSITSLSVKTKYPNRLIKKLCTTCTLPQQFIIHSSVQLKIILIHYPSMKRDPATKP